MKLILVRHGESEANLLQELYKKGDNSLFDVDLLGDEKVTDIPEDSLISKADSSFRLSDKGREQARCAGEFIKAKLGKDLSTGKIKCFLSPYLRTRETAGYMNLEGASWTEETLIRERYWGDINSLPNEVFRSLYSLNSNLKKIDTLYWQPPGGESLVQVSEQRSRKFIEDLLEKVNPEDTALAVTHGEFMWATRLYLENWSPEEFISRDSDKSQKIHNCAVLEYSRKGINGEISEDSYLKVRRSYPVLDEATGLFSMCVGDWEEIKQKPTFSSEDLLAKARDTKRIFAEGE